VRFAHLPSPSVRDVNNLVRCIYLERRRTSALISQRARCSDLRPRTSAGAPRIQRTSSTIHVFHFALGRDGAHLRMRRQCHTSVGARSPSGRTRRAPRASPQIGYAQQNNMDMVAHAASHTMSLPRVARLPAATAWPGGRLSPARVGGAYFFFSAFSPSAFEVTPSSRSSTCSSDSRLNSAMISSIDLVPCTALSRVRTLTEPELSSSLPTTRM